MNLMRRPFSFLLCLCTLAFSLTAQQQLPNAILPPEIHKQFLDVNGKPLVGGYIYTCVAGTACSVPVVGGAPSNPLATYQDAGATVSNANPIVLDYTGYAAIRLGRSAYKIVAQDRFGVQQWTLDNVTATFPNTTFDTLGSGTNLSATMIVGTGASLSYLSGGTINASQLGGVPAASYLFTDFSNIATIRHSLLFQDAAYNIGASGANRPNNGYFAGTLYSNGANITGDVTVSNNIQANIVSADINFGNIAGVQTQNNTGTLGTGAGTGATITKLGASDSLGEIIITTGTSPAANAPIITINLTNPVTALNVVFSPIGPNSAGAQVYVSHSEVAGQPVPSFTLNSGNVALAASTSYAWSFIAIK